jgi:Glycosyltransferase family 17
VRRVWDCFIFCDELDLLECRLTELDSAVYRFVISEAPVTFQGNPKPLHYLENRKRFTPWADKITYVRADLSGCRDHGSRESVQRESLRLGFGGMRDEDIFLLSDVDEIPRPDILQQAPGHLLMMRNHVAAVNLVEANWWSGTIAVGGCPKGGIQKLRDLRQTLELKPLPRANGWPMIAGWHFSWLGGPEASRAKVHSFGHPEMAPLIDENAERFWKEKISLSTGNTLMETVIDESWPKYMQERKGPASWYWGDQ